MCGIMARFQSSGAFDSQPGDNARANYLCLPVPAQVPCHHLGPLDAVRHLPGFRFNTQDGKFERQVMPIPLDEGIHAASIGFEDATAMRWQLLDCRSRRAVHTQAARKAIRFNRDFAKYLGESTVANASIEFHLPEWLLRMHAAPGI